jgi:ParB-like chromosome segregation protein Spo0J
VLHNVVQTPIDSLVLAERNARKHSKEQIHRLASGISTHGFLVPILGYAALMASTLAPRW